jgi:hypothetical protein
MDLDKRYTPLTERKGFEEFGDKYFRNINEINYTDKLITRKQKIYPMGWDNYQDRDMVWTTKPEMIGNFIIGQKRHCVNNPINIITLKDNIESLKAGVGVEQYKHDIKYFQKFVDMGYEYFVFIGKNRVTLPIFQIYQGIKSGDEEFKIFKAKDVNNNYIYNVEYKIFNKYMDNQWKGEFYRGEKTIFPDSDIMMKISYDCDINRTVYTFSEDDLKRETYKKTWNEPAFTNAKPKGFMDECMYYEKNGFFIGASSEMDRWENNDNVPKKFSTNWETFEKFYKYISEYSNGKTDFEGIWFKENRLRLVYKTISDLKKLNYIPKDKKNGWNKVFDRLIEFIESEQLNRESYGWTTRTELDFRQLLSGMKVAGDIYTQRPFGASEKKKYVIESLQQHHIITDIFGKKLFGPLLVDGILVDVEPRGSISTQEKFRIFFRNDMMIRINGQKKDTGEWFNPNDKTLYKKATFKEFVQMERNLDHILSLKSGKGTNDEDNLEWATKEYNAWKAEDEIAEIKDAA